MMSNVGVDFSHYYSGSNCHQPSSLTWTYSKGGGANGMALDFENYLIASSPPGFEVLVRSGALNGLSHENGFSDIINGTSNCSLTKKELRVDCDERLSSFCDRSQDQERIMKWEQSYACDEETCSCITTKDHPSSAMLRRKRGKRVSFIDDVNGSSLAEVRLLHQTSDAPPDLLPDIIDQFELDLNDTSETVPRLMINFAQPAADYLAFREKVESNCVSLENVVIRNNCLIGTIKVKNISYSKTVMIRCTFDDWKTHRDFSAAYQDYGKVYLNQFDTFSFEIDVPTSAERVQFAVCCEEEGRQFWDSNSGQNYEVVSTTKKVSAATDLNTTADTVFSTSSRSQSDPWSEYSGWSDIRTNCPYW